MSKHVLVPIDGSTSAWNALTHAIERESPERLTVLHVVDPTENIYAGVEEGYFDTDAFDRAFDRGGELCEEAHRRAEKADHAATIEVETAVEPGKPARTIVSYAEGNDIDMIVMGSRGRSGLSRVLLGSVAETVVRRASVPVTVVR